MSEASLQEPRSRCRETWGQGVILADIQARCHDGLASRHALYSPSSNRGRRVPMQTRQDTLWHHASRATQACHAPHKRHTCVTQAKLSTEVDSGEQSLLAETRYSCPRVSISRVDTEGRRQRLCHVHGLASPAPPTQAASFPIAARSHRLPGRNHAQAFPKAGSRLLHDRLCPPFASDCGVWSTISVRARRPIRRLSAARRNRTELL
ncbi:hypothetical protein HDV57DRAFT_269705 [Trichoderma longibrachiatum]